MERKPSQKGSRALADEVGSVEQCEWDTVLSRSCAREGIHVSPMLFATKSPNQQEERRKTHVV